MARENGLEGVVGIKVTIAPGATNAVLMTPIAGEISSGIKYFSGGSLEILQCPSGSTLTNAQLVAAQGNSTYLLGTPINQYESLNFDGAVRYYLMATGATVVCYQLKGLSTGF